MLLNNTVYTGAYASSQDFLYCLILLFLFPQKTTLWDAKETSDGLFGKSPTKGAETKSCHILTNAKEDLQSLANHQNKYNSAVFN